METSNSGANHAVFQAQNYRWSLGPMENSNSGANRAVLQAQNDRWGLGPMETINSAHNVAVVNARTTDEGWDTLRVAILVLKSLFWM